MANFIRSAKSSSDWSSSELLSYNIAITPVAPNNFFRHGADPSLDHLDPAILNTVRNADNEQLSQAVAAYLAYLDLATYPTQETVIDNFAAETLKLVGFNERNILVMTSYIIPLLISGDPNRVAQTDVCLLHRPSLVLLVLVTDKAVFNNWKTDAEPQVVAEAIAAFQFNNKKRGERGLPLLEAMIIPCITMAGTRPTFYLVPVTQELSNAVILGQYPETQTQVMKCVTVRANSRRASEGMEDIDYRKLALKRLLAFKTLAKSHWEHITNGL